MRKTDLFRGWSAFDWMLFAAAVIVACLRALTAPGIGDYPNDAGPALSAIAHGSLGGFFGHQPAMGAVSLYLRAPFAALAVHLHDSTMGVYRWGDLPCLLALAAVAAACARRAGRGGMSRTGQLLTVAMCLVNPLVSNALSLGHPEEILAGALVLAALLAAADQRMLSAAILTGLAVATKQWALVIVCPVLLVLERERLRAALLMLATGAVVTAPMLLANVASFRHALDYISSPQPNATMFSWLYPVLPFGSARSGLPFGPARPYSGHLATGIVVSLSHPLILVLGVAIPLIALRLASRRLSPTTMLLCAALVLLLRCTLDAGSWPYYHLAALLALVACDAVAGRRLPVYGLVGWACAFTILDRFPSYLSTDAANLLYIAFTVAGVAVLASLIYSSERGLDRRPSRFDRLRQPLGITSARPG